MGINYKGNSFLYSPLVDDQIDQRVRLFFIYIKNRY
jgi:hypothetical protein